VSVWNSAGAELIPRESGSQAPATQLHNSRAWREAGQVLWLWVCGGRKRFMAWNDNIGHPIVTKSTTIYVALVEGLRRREGSIVNLTIYGNLETLVRSKEICLYLYGGFRPLCQWALGNQHFKKCDLTCIFSFLPDSYRVGALDRPQTIIYKSAFESTWSSLHTATNPKEVLCHSLHAFIYIP